jgi:hypothetical protein
MIILDDDQKICPNCGYEPVILGRPQIVCLCGSSRFIEDFEKATFDWTSRGYIVLSPCFYTPKTVISPLKRLELSRLHRDKIAIADMVFVLNIDGYIGRSTKSEIKFATNLGKTIQYVNKP